MKLHLFDIEGLDKISIWPLAPAWWAMLALFAFTFIFYLGARFWRERCARDWRRQVNLKLDAMAADLKPETSGEVATHLAELMRRLALKNHSRETCAAITGPAWLDWLSASDPKKFAWGEARFLIEAPYRPARQTYAVHEIRRALDAAKGWVK